MNISGRVVTLRAIEHSDLAQLHQWANDAALQRMLGGWHFPTSMRDQEAWLARQSCQSPDQRYVVDLPEQRCIGTANLVSIDWKNRTAFQGLMVGDPAIRGKGFGIDILMALMRYAFDELGLERLDTDIIEYNESSLKLHIDRCGWEIEGRKPAWYFRDGRRWDKVLLGIPRARYRALAAESRYWEQA